MMKPSPVTLRGLQAGDLPAFSALFQRVFAQSPWNERWDLDQIRRGLETVMRKPGFIGVAAERQTQAVGFMTGYALRLFPLTPAIFYLDQLFVDDRHQGTGAGRALLEAGLGLAAGHGYRSVLLLTKAGTASERFYRKHGFKRFFSFLRLGGKILLVRSLR